MSRWTDTRNCEEIELEFWTQSSHFGVQPQLSTITIITITNAFFNHHPPITTIIINLYWRWCTRGRGGGELDLNINLTLDA